MITETTFKIDAMRRDLERLADYVNDGDDAGVRRTLERMIDTAESMGHKVTRDDIVTIATKIVSEEIVS